MQTTQHGIYALENAIIPQQLIPRKPGDFSPPALEAERCQLTRRIQTVISNLVVTVILQSHLQASCHINGFQILGFTVVFLVFCLFVFLINSQNFNI